MVGNQVDHPAKDFLWERHRSVQGHQPRPSDILQIVRQLHRFARSFSAGATPFAPFGHFSGQLTMWSSKSLSFTSVSQAPTLPRTDTPAACTLSGSPETSGCHQYKSLPAATSL